MKQIFPIQKNKISFLIVEDDDKERELLFKLVKTYTKYVDTVSTLKDGLDIVERKFFNIILLDLRLPDGDGKEIFDKVRKISPETYVIILTAFGDIEDAVETVKQGAFHYLLKPFLPSQLFKIIDEALKEQKELFPLSYYRKLDIVNSLITTQSKEMLDIVKITQKFAKTKNPILIKGEFGTEKDEIAQILHISRNVEAKFITISDDQEFKEKFLKVEKNSTLYFPEIKNISEINQNIISAKMDKFIEQNIKFIFATSEQKDFFFNEKLHYYVGAFIIEIPPLRERPEDVPLIIAKYLPEGYKITKKSLEVLKEYPWPGNVKELRNVIEYACIVCEGMKITCSSLPEKIRKNIVDNAGLPSLEEVEKEHIKKVLEYTGYNITRASQILGISRKTLWEKRKKYGI